MSTRELEPDVTQRLVDTARDALSALEVALLFVPAPEYPGTHAEVSSAIHELRAVLAEVDEP